MKNLSRGLPTQQQNYKYTSDNWKMSKTLITMHNIEFFLDVNYQTQVNLYRSCVLLIWKISAFHKL